METKFDPDDVSVTADPEYERRVDTPGPMNNVRWAPIGKPSAAKRLEMLEIDREMNDAWLATMEKLYARDLTDAEFTTERMLRLRLWTKERKRRQHNLHYKYDPTRRASRLVNRDVDRQLAKVKAQLESVWVRRPDMAPEGWVPPAIAEATRPSTVRPEALSQPVRPPRAPDRRPAADSISALPLALPASPAVDEAPPTFDDMVRRDTGIVDLAGATDDQILDAYATKTTTPPAAAQWYLAKLRGRPLPLLADS